MTVAIFASDCCAWLASCECQESFRSDNGGKATVDVRFALAAGIGHVPAMPWKSCFMIPYYLTAYRAAHLALVSDNASQRLAQVLIEKQGQQITVQPGHR